MSIPLLTWTDLLLMRLDELQEVARTQFGDLLIDRAGMTYLSEDDAAYGIDGFADLGAIRDWLYYYIRNTA